MKEIVIMFFIMIVIIWVVGLVPPCKLPAQYLSAEKLKACLAD